MKMATLPLESKGRPPQTKILVVRFLAAFLIMGALPSLDKMWAQGQAQGPRDPSHLVSLALLEELGWGLDLETSPQGLTAAPVKEEVQGQEMDLTKGLGLHQRTPS